MATVYQPQDQDDKQKKQNGTMLAQGANGTDSNIVQPDNKPQAPSGQKASSSGSFTNIQNYINANKNSGIGDKIVNKVEGVADAAQNQLKNTQESFKQAAEANKGLAYNENPFSQIGQAKKLDDVSSAFADATAQLNTDYKGPMELGNQSAIYGQQQQLQGLAKNSSSDNGRAAMLKQFFNKPTYAQGQQRLDTLLVGAKDERPKLQATKGISAEFGRGVNDAVSSSAAQAQALKQSAAQTRDQARNAFDTQDDVQQKDLENQIAAYDQSEQERATKRFDLANNPIQLQDSTRAMANALGLDDQTLLRAGGQYNAGKADLTNINPEQAAVFNKIRGLIGGQTLSIGDKVKEGTYGFNESGVNSAIAPIYSKLNDMGVGGYGQLSSTLGDTSQLNAIGYSPDQLSRFLNDKGGESGINEVWGGYGRSGDDAIGDLVRYNNQRRQEAKQQALNNALSSLYKQSGYQG